MGPWAAGKPFHLRGERAPLGQVTQTVKTTAATDKATASSTAPLLGSLELEALPRSSFVQRKSDHKHAKKKIRGKQKHSPPETLKIRTTASRCPVVPSRSTTVSSSPLVLVSFHRRRRCRLTVAAFMIREPSEDCARRGPRPTPSRERKKKKITIERTRSKEEWSDRRGTPRSGNGPRCAPQRRHGGFIWSRSHRNKSRGSNPWHVPMFTGTRVRACVVCSGFYERVEEDGASRK